jgi:hypothetical protein
MMMKITMSLAALALGGGLTVGTAFAQHTGARSADDNGIPNQSSQSSQSSQSAQPSPSRGPYDQSNGAYGQSGPYDQSSGMYNEAPGMGAPGNQSAVASCEMRFRSYDPATGTYVGFDGTRHPCP